MAMTLEPCPFKKWTANMYDDAADRLEDLVGTVAAATQVEMLRDAAKMVRAHLTQPVQPCPHIVSADEGTSYCSLAESAKPAQAVDVGAIREVIDALENNVSDCARNNLPSLALHLRNCRDKLARAIGTAQEGWRIDKCGDTWTVTYAPPTDGEG